MEFSRCFRLSTRSHHILLSSESVTSECSRIAAYERHSQSMRLTGEEYDFSDQHNYNYKELKRGMGLLGKLFSFTRLISSSSHDQDEDPNNNYKVLKKHHKKRSSWLPDPQKRWPIQGW